MMISVHIVDYIIFVASQFFSVVNYRSKVTP